jgi:hypothetical protein
MLNMLNTTGKTAKTAMESVKEYTAQGFMSTLSVLASGAALPSWICVVERDQVWRDSKSGVLFEVASVKAIDVDAQVMLRTVDARPGEEDVSVRASDLCAGTAWSRLPDEGETTSWRGPVTPTRVGLRPLSSVCL